LPLLHETARELPAAIRSELRHERASALAALARREAAEGRVLAALADLGPVLLKGAALAVTLYPARELRPRGDLDLLLAPREAAEAARRLIQIGYRRHSSTIGGVQDDPGRHEQTFAHPDEGGVAIDLHRAFCQPQRTRVDVEAMVARAVPAKTIEGARVLDRDDALLAHAVNLATHELRVPLVHLADLSRLWAACQPAVVIARARAMRLRRALGCALWLLEEIAGPWFAGQAIELAGVRAAREELLRGHPHGLLGRLVSRYDPTRQPLGRVEQLWRKALLIDDPLDAARFALAHAWASLQAARRSGPSPELLAWDSPAH
jgi:hypothetical protein